MARLRRARPAGRRTVLAAAVVTVAVAALTGCAWFDEDGVEGDGAVTAEREEAPAEDSPADEGDEGSGPESDLVNASLRDPLRDPSDNFEERDFDGTTSLAFTGGAYRMVSAGGPLLSPLLDEELAGMTRAEVSVDVDGVSTPGLVGVACGVDQGGAYLFVAGLNEDAEPYYSIGRLDLRQARMRALRDSNLPDTPDAADVLPRDGGFTIGGECEPGEASDEAVLTLTLDGEGIAKVLADFGPPTGQVGLFALGQGPQPFEVDLTEFEASGSFE